MVRNNQHQLHHAEQDNVLRINEQNDNNDRDNRHFNSESLQGSSSPSIESSNTSSMHTFSPNNGETDSQKTELQRGGHKYDHPHEKIFKTEISIKMEEPVLTTENTMEGKVGRPEAKTDKTNVGLASSNNSSSSSISKQPLSRNTTRSSESDPIVIDCEETDNGSSRGCSEIDGDEDRSDFSSDYGTDKSMELADRLHHSNASLSTSPSPEMLELQGRESSPIPPKYPVSLSDDSRRRYDSQHSHASSAGHDNLAFIAEENESAEEESNGSKDPHSNEAGVAEKPSPNIASKAKVSRSQSIAQRVDKELRMKNLQRVILRDFRREIVLSADRQDGICLNTFLKLGKKKVGFAKKIFD